MNRNIEQARAYSVSILIVLILVFPGTLTYAKGKAGEESANQTDQSTPTGYWPGKGPYIYPDVKKIFPSRNLGVLGLVPIMQIPEEVLKKMTTDDLIISYINWPIGRLVHLNVRMEKDKHEWYQKNLKVYNELRSRKDAGKKLLEYFSALPANPKENDPLFDDVKADPMGYELDDRKIHIYYLMLILNDERIIAKLDRKQKMALLAEELKKRQEMIDLKISIFFHSNAYMYFLGNMLKNLEYKPFYQEMAVNGSLAQLMSPDFRMFVDGQTRKIIVSLAKRALADVETEYGLSDLEHTSLTASINEAVKVRKEEMSKYLTIKSARLEDRGGAGYWPGHGSYIFPESRYYAGTGVHPLEWRKVPKEVLQKMTMDELIITYLNSPLVRALHGFSSSRFGGCKRVKTETNLFEELVTRKDASQRLLEFYVKLSNDPKEIDPIFVGLITDPYGTGNLGGQRSQHINLLTLTLGYEEFLIQLNESDKILLLETGLEKFKYIYAKVQGKYYVHQDEFARLFGNTLIALDYRPFVQNVELKARFKKYVTVIQYLFDDEPIEPPDPNVGFFDRKDFAELLKLTEKAVAEYRKAGNK